MKDKMNKKEKYSYVFPQKMAKLMASVSMRTQMEAGMMSQLFLIMGLSLMILYVILFGGTSLWYKFLVIFNMLCGWVLIGSYLITTYQQYSSYMGAMGIDPDEEKRKVKSKGNIFKRIKLAIEKRKQKKRDKEIEKISPTPQLVKDALEHYNKEVMVVRIEND